MNDNTVCCQNESATEPQRDPRLSLEPIFKNSNFSKEEFSDTSSVPKTLFIIYKRDAEDVDPYRFGGFSNVISVGEGLAPPDILQKAVAYLR